MRLLNLTIVLLGLITSALAVYELRPAPPPLFPNRLCRDFTTVFTQFGSRCTLATHFMAPSTPTTVHLWVYDINCVLIGENPSVPSERAFDFDSQLPYALVMDRFWSMTPPGFWYAGMGWGSDDRECWVDDEKRYVCSQVFQC
jgi:hypothetical protein